MDLGPTHKNLKLLMNHHSLETDVHGNYKLVGDSNLTVEGEDLLFLNQLCEAMI